MQVAHALSTHRMEHEFDYYTAVDDLRDPFESDDDRGAAMIGDIEFTSACYYKYFSIDLDGFVDNLVGEGAVRPEERARARELAEKTTLAFLEAAVFTSPSGKQNTFAAHQLPDAILVELRDRKVPVSYANAFVNPVTAGRGGLGSAVHQRFYGASNCWHANSPCRVASSGLRRGAALEGARLARRSRNLARTGRRAAGARPNG